jgi:hypothetical protein
MVILDSFRSGLDSFQTFAALDYRDSGRVPGLRKTSPLLVDLVDWVTFSLSVMGGSRLCGRIPFFAWNISLLSLCRYRSFSLRAPSWWYRGNVWSLFLCVISEWINWFWHAERDCRSADPIESNRRLDVVEENYCKEREKMRAVEIVCFSLLNTPLNLDIIQLTVVTWADHFSCASMWSSKNCVLDVLHYLPLHW